MTIDADTRPAAARWLLATSPVPPPWDALTHQPEKAALYVQDTYFRQAWADLASLVGRDPRERPAGDAGNGLAGGDARHRLHRYANVMFKPDAVVGRRIEPCLEFLARAGFEAVAHYPVRLSRVEAAELWRYQHNAATLHRVSSTLLYMTACESLLVVLADRTPVEGVPATVRLRHLKGLTEPPAGEGVTLRRLAGRVNRIMAMLHSADEPMDVLREFGLLLAPGARRALLRRLLADPGPDDPGPTLAALHRRNPPVAFDAGQALERTVAAIRRCPHAGDAEERGLLAHLEAVARGTARLDWCALEAWCLDHDVVLPLWDLVQVATSFIHYDDSDDMLIPDDRNRGWPLPAASSTATRLPQ